MTNLKIKPGSEDKHSSGSAEKFNMVMKIFTVQVQREKGFLPVHLRITNKNRLISNNYIDINNNCSRKKIWHTYCIKEVEGKEIRNPRIRIQVTTGRSENSQKTQRGTQKETKEASHD